MSNSSRPGLRWALLAAALALPFGSRAQAPDVPRAEAEPAAQDALVEVRVEGNRRVEPEAIRRALRQKVGQVFQASRSAEDLKALWSLNYFDDVQLLVQRLPQGGIAYVVRVVERPSVREVKLQGNDEIGSDDFKETIDIKPFSILDVSAVQRNLKKIQDKYVEKGFFLAEVTYELKAVEGLPEVDVVFVINEHAKVMVKEVNLIGAKKVSPEDIKQFMMTREGGLLSFLTSEGTYKEENFQRDLQAIQAVYYDRGYIKVKVEKPSVSLSPDKRYIYVSIQIDEGEAFRLGKIDFKGDMLVSAEEFRKRMVSNEGDLFSRSKLGTDIQAITDVFWDQGYAYANPTPVTDIHDDTRTVDLTFELQKGEPVTIERIEVVGNSKTRDRVIRRQMRVYEGELFNGTAMRKSKDRVTALGFFETVEVTHKPGRDDKSVVVRVEIKEKSTGTFQVGLGFSNTENFIFTAQVAQQNMLGWGQTVSASAQISSLRQLVQLSFFEPYLWDTDFNLGLDFYRTQWDFFGFLREATGGTVNLGYYLLEDLSINAGYTLENVRVEAASSQDEVQLANQFRNGVTSALRLSATWDKRNNRLFPTAGHMQFFSAEFGPKFLGGSFNYNRYTAFSRFYFPLPFGLVLKTNLQAGLITQLDPKLPLPVSEMYFLGGINTIRGYLLRSVSPCVLVPGSNRPDAIPSCFAVGGDKQIILNVELEFPILTAVGIRGVLFYDAGNVYAVGSSFFEDKQHKLPLGLFHSVGFGVRWFSPIGPLRFEWGVPLNRRTSGDQPLLFEFTIGNSF